MLEVRINKEINEYQETIFFGLTMRQFVCSVSAVVTALFLYILLHDVIGREIVSWICIIGAIPVVVAGFFKYNGMTFERFVWAWFKSEVLYAGNRVWKSVHVYDLLHEAKVQPDKKLPFRKKKVVT